MNSQLDQKTTAYNSDFPIENESTEIHNSVSPRLEPSRINKTASVDDELIASLQNHRENRRARQVFEWEAARRDCQAPQFLRGAA